MDAILLATLIYFAGPLIVAVFDLVFLVYSLLEAVSKKVYSPLVPLGVITIVFLSAFIWHCLWESHSELGPENVPAAFVVVICLIPTLKLIQNIKEIRKLPSAKLKAETFVLAPFSVLSLLVMFPWIAVMLE